MKKKRSGKYVELPDGTKGKLYNDTLKDHPDGKVIVYTKEKGVHLAGILIDPKKLKMVGFF